MAVGRDGGGGGAVAAGSLAAAEIAADVLAAGGNAADALVAGVVASWASEPTVSGPCGGAFALVRDAATGQVTLLDAFVAVPGLAGGERLSMLPFDVEFGTTRQRFWIGPGSCAVPGTAAGVGEVHRRFGSRPWHELVIPAIALAEQGAVVSPQHEILHTLLAGLLTAMPAGRAVFAPDGTLLTAGSRVRQPALARTLGRLAETGVGDLYTGELARQLASFFADAGAPLSADDLAAYRVIARTPVRAGYRGHEIVTNAPPSSGGPLIAHALGVAGPHRPGREATGARRALLLAAALREADARRTPALAAALARGDASSLVGAEALAAGAEAVGLRLAGGAAPDASTLPTGGGTTHISVVDARGNVAAMTSSTGCGSGVFVADSGIHMNNMLGEEDLVPEGVPPLLPGDRMTSMMSPTMVLGPDGMEVVLGSSGSARIRSAIARVVGAIVDDGLDPQAAIDLPRLHPTRDGLDVEPGFASAALAALEEAGERLVRWPDRDIYFGGAQVAERRRGRLLAGGDPRRGGAGVVVLP